MRALRTFLLNTLKACLSASSIFCCYKRARNLERRSFFEPGQSSLSFLMHPLLLLLQVLVPPVCSGYNVFQPFQIDLVLFHHSASSNRDQATLHTYGKRSVTLTYGNYRRTFSSQISVSYHHGCKIILSRLQPLKHSSVHVLIVGPIDRYHLSVGEEHRVFLLIYLLPIGNN